MIFDAHQLSVQLCQQDLWQGSEAWWGTDDCALMRLSPFRDRVSTLIKGCPKREVVMISSRAALYSLFVSLYQVAVQAHVDLTLGSLPQMQLYDSNPSPNLHPKVLILAFEHGTFPKLNPNH